MMIDNHILGLRNTSKLKMVGVLVLSVLIHSPVFSSPIDLINLNGAHEITKGSSSVKIAVLSGSDPYDPILRPRILLNEGETGGGKEFDGIDNDANGYVDDYMGVNTLSQSNTKIDINGHGTKMSKLILNFNTGVAPGVSLVPVGCLNDAGSSSGTALLKALEYAISRKVDIVVIDLSFDRLSAELNHSICETIRSSDSLFVIAAGNAGVEINGTTGMFLESCQLSNMIVVAAADEKGRLAKYSNFGVDRVDLLVPGTRISLPEGEEINGTSPAASLAAGVAALVKSQFPELKSYEIKSKLIMSANSSFPTFGKVRSYGLLDASKAVK